MTKAVLFYFLTILKDHLIDEKFLFEKLAGLFIFHPQIPIKPCIDATQRKLVVGEIWRAHGNYSE